MAVGPVRVEGLAERPTPLRSPFTGTDCVFYRFMVEEYRSRGRSSEWVVVSKGDSSDQSFAISDETGSSAVLPRGAEFFLPESHLFETGLFHESPPPEALAYLSAVGISPTNLFGVPRRMRFREWIIPPAHRVVIIATACSTLGDLTQRKNTLLTERLSQLKHDPARLARYDVNHDGTVSVEEWDVARQDVESEVNSELAGERRELVLARGDNYFVIADESQARLLGEMGRKALAGIFLGPLLAAVGLVVMMAAAKN